MRIGILGGTFNPVHNGHLYIAQEARKKLSLNKVVFVPAHIPPHKKIKGNATAINRVRMLKLALKRRKGFSFSLYEIRKKGVSYSVDTLKYFRKKYGKHTKLFFIIGSDWAGGLKGWKKAQELARLAVFVIAPRPGFKRKKVVKTLRIARKDISSSEIRKRVKNGKAVKNLIPKSVAKYIYRKKIYL
ncbi:MAG: nicotinate (nicotinamide) nucleotide adenylyltransferase [Candidatus Omnitrophica bacterium]|nr:nicotinate (nicotinamide) nucleotide adenylyltransferase [Candidatus Omnitrophota bacterium]